MRRTKYRTEKTKRLKTKALKKETLFEPNFWVTDVTQKDDFFLGGGGGCQTVPLDDLFSTTVSDVTVADRPRFQMSLQEVLFPGEINPKISFCTVQKREKKTKPEIFPLLLKLHWFFRQTSLTHTCRN